MSPSAAPLKTTANVFLELAGHSELILTEVSGTERLSGDFLWEARGYSTKPLPSPKDLLGSVQSIVVKTKTGAERFFSGVVSKFRTGPAIHVALSPELAYPFYLEIRPQFWLLQLMSDCQIFQNKSTVKILDALFQSQNVKAATVKARGGHTEREYCVQYNETSFSFASRLLEQEGIFYFFKFDRSGDIMMLGDSPNAYIPLPSPKLEMAGPLFSQIPLEKVLSWSQDFLALPSAVAYGDFNYLKPTSDLFTNMKTKEIGGEMFHYPGGYTSHEEGMDIAQKRLEALEWNATVFSGRSTIPALSPGHTGTLPEAGDIVFFEVYHQIRLDETKQELIYENTFYAIPATVTFRPPLKTPLPTIYGAQTAIVTGKTDEEIWTDEYGRIKVKFHWDRKGKSDETSSCWVRVSTAWAGNQWGNVFTPRIGQEVVVTFINGNPDCPLVTGAVYNGVNKPPYRPDSPTKSTVKSHTSKKGDGFNEMRFEDKKKAEEIYFHAQRDWTSDILNNQTETIYAGNRTVTLKGEEGKDGEPGIGDDFLTLNKGSRTIKLLAEGEKAANHTIEMTHGDQRVTIERGNRSVTLEAGNDSLKIVGTQNVDIAEECTFKIGGSLTIDVGGMISMKAGGAIDIDAGAEISLKAGAAINATAGGEIGLEAGGIVTVDAEGAVAVDAEGAVTINALGAVAIDAAGAVAIDAGGAVAVDAGGAVTVNGGGAVAIEGGGAASLIGGGVTTVIGAMVIIG